MTYPITVCDYQTGDYLRDATAADLESAKRCDPYTGVFSDPTTGVSRFLVGCAFDGERYDFDTREPPKGQQHAGWAPRAGEVVTFQKTINQREARAEGVRNGYAIAMENAVRVANEWLQSGAGTVGETCEAAIVNAALEAEVEHFRQFSPFEDFAKSINDCEERTDGLWAAYEDGVRRGAVKAARRFIATARVHLVDPKETETP